MNPIETESGVTKNEAKVDGIGYRGMEPGFGNDGLLGGLDLLPKVHFVT